MKYAAAISPLAMNAAGAGEEAEGDECAADRFDERGEAEQRHDLDLLSSEHAEQLLHAVQHERVAGYDAERIVNALCVGIEKTHHWSSSFR